MSSSFTPDPRRFLPEVVRRLASGASVTPSLNAEEQWQTLTRSQQLQALGAPDVDIEQARQQERLLGPTGISTVVGATTGRGDPFFETEQPEPRRGLLEILSDYATRPQSAVTGFVTGLAGADRLRQTRDPRGVSDGTLFERPKRVEGGLGLALERFAQGLTGQEKFQAADFGVLAYDREEAGAGERALKSTAGFILDVAIDPLTYLSFGGSILGRRAAAVAVNEQARKNALRVVSSLDEAGKETLFRGALARAGTDESIIAAGIRDQINTTFAGPDMLRTFNFPATGPVRLEDAMKVLRQNPELLDGAAADALAYTTAAMYRSFGPGGARKYLVKEFGDAGADLWRAMPGDLQGGVRFRVPLSGTFNRAASGAPMASAIRIGPQAGAVGDLTGLSGMSNRGREWMRSKALLRPIGDNLSGMTGATDRATASLIFRRSAERSKRFWGEKIPEVDPKLRATSWASSNELEAALGQFRAGVMGSARQLMAPVTEGQKAYREGMELGGDQFSELFDKAIKANLMDEGGDVASINNLFGIDGRVATRQEVLAYEAASNYQMALRQIESDLMALESRTAGFVPSLLENYWPRIVDDMEREFTGKGYRGGFSNLKERTHFVAEFNPDGSVRRWMTPREIGQQLGRPKFVENADVAMSAYLVSMNRFIAEERLFQHLLDRGVLLRGGRDQFLEEWNPTAASKKWLEVTNAAKAKRAALQALGRDENAPRISAGRLEGRSLDEAVERARELGTALEAGRVYGPKLFSQYEEVSPGVFRSIEGVSIRRLPSGGHQISRTTRDGAAEYLNPGEGWSKVRPNEVFPTLDDAKYAADQNIGIEWKRKFVEEMEQVRDEFLEAYTTLLRTTNDLDAAGVNPLHPGNIPLDHQDDYFQQMADAIAQFGEKVDLKDRRLLANFYRDEKWGAGRGAAFAPVSGTDGPQMRKFWADRMARLNIFAPETIVGDIKRLYRAIDNPEGFRKWVDEYYRPFYALQKSLMTSQRGPGYVLRNIQGGMWNAYLVGTTGRHFKLAGTVKVAEYQARARAKKAAPDNVKRQAEVMREEFIKIINSRLGERRGRQMLEAWESFERRGLRGREIASRTAGTQAVAQASGELSGDLVRLIPDADQNSVQRLAEWGTSHWWARTMGEGAQGSEDFLRFAAFLRGVDMYGLEDGGRAASLMVKASQFDYSDLSQFEAQSVKMLVPFYTWTRNNVPLQLRAIIAEPGKMMKAIRLNDALADAFGDPEDPEEPLPSYVRERFGWRIRKDIATGPSGDALSAGMVVGEPLVDVNRLFGERQQPGAWGLASVLNWREVANNLNPIVKTGAQATTAMELSTGGRLPREEEAPGWAAALGLGRVTPEGDRVMSSRALRTVRDIVVPLGMAERYAPQLLGNERLQRRWYTSLGSAILGLPVSTLDPFQTTAELRQQEQRLRSQLTREMGEEYPDRVAYVREALALGASPQELQFIRDNLLGGRNVSEVPLEELDRYRMRDTINFLRRIETLRAQGVPEQTLEMMADYFRPRTDAEMGVRAGGPQPLTAEQLAEVGESPESVARMTDGQRADVVARYAARNPSWRPKG